MSLRIFPVAAPLTSLLLFSTFVVAEVTVTANCTSPSFAWVCHIVVPKWTTHFVALSDLMASYPDIQLIKPKPVLSRCIHVFYMLLGV
jgi:hypothetical protein